MTTEPRRLRSGVVMAESGAGSEPDAVAIDVDRLVDAVVTRLTASGIGTEAAAAAIKEEEPEVVGGVATSPSRAQQQLWLAELRRQLAVPAATFGTREREEVRGLLIIGEGGGLPPDHSHWFWGRVRLFLIVAHEGWGVAVRDARSSDMERLGIHLSRDVVQPPAAARPRPPPPASAPASGWRGHASRPSGLRVPPRGAAPPAASRR